QALGPNARPTELDAGAGALLAGVPEDSLADLKRTRPTGSLVIPLIVLSDFVARGVPVGDGATTVLSAPRAGAAEAALLPTGEPVTERSLGGERRTGAARDGLRELLSRTEPGSARRSGGREPHERRRP